MNKVKNVGFVMEWWNERDTCYVMHTNQPTNNEKNNHRLKRLTSEKHTNTHKNIHGISNEWWIFGADMCIPHFDSQTNNNKKVHVWLRTLIYFDSTTHSLRVCARSIFDFYLFNFIMKICRTYTLIRTFIQHKHVHNTLHFTQIRRFTYSAVAYRF